MDDYKSIVELIKLPHELNIMLAGIVIFLCIAPYVEVIEISNIKFKGFSLKDRKFFKITGPLSVLSFIVLQLPIVSMATSGSFQNFEPNNGTSDNDNLNNYCREIWFSSCESESTTVHTGMRSARVEVKKHEEDSTETGGTVRIPFSSRIPVDLSRARSITAWVYDTHGNNTIELKLCNGDICPDKVWSQMRSVKNRWVEIMWPVSNFTKVNKHNITGIEIYEWNKGVYYFDDINWQ